MRKSSKNRESETGTRFDIHKDSEEMSLIGEPDVHSTTKITTPLVTTKK